MPVYEIDCPHCGKDFEIQVGLDMDSTVALLRERISESDKIRKFAAFRTYVEILALCGDKAKSLGANEFNVCVRYSVERGFLERRKIGHQWKFRQRKRHEYGASPSRQRKRRTGIDWGLGGQKPTGPNNGLGKDS